VCSGKVRGSHDLNQSLRVERALFYKKHSWVLQKWEESRRGIGGGKTKSNTFTIVPCQAGEKIPRKKKFTEESNKEEAGLRKLVTQAASKAG